MTRGASTTPGWSRNLQATQTVRRHAADDTDRRTLLDMLGLTQPGSRLLAADDNNAYGDVTEAVAYDGRL